MTELKYDPELPFVVRIKFSEELLGRFSDLQDADQSADTVYGGYDTEVIDTTPKPNIPEDAEFLTWIGRKDYYSRYAQNGPSGGWWVSSEGDTEYLTMDQLIRLIGEAEVTVLVRKEES